MITDKHLPLIKTGQDRAEIDKFLLLPAAMAGELAHFADIKRLKFIPINYGRGEGLTHIFVALNDQRERLAGWLRVRNEAILFEELNSRSGKIFIEQGYTPCFSVADDLTLPAECALLLRSSNTHLFISSIPNWRPLANIVKPALDYAQAGPVPAAPQGLIKLRLVERTTPALKPAALVLSNDERQQLASWLSRAPQQLINGLRVYRDQYRVIVFNTATGLLPQIACGQSLVEYAELIDKRVLVPAHLDIAPRLPAVMVMAALGVGEQSTCLLIREGDQFQRLLIADNDITMISRAWFKVYAQ